MLRSNRVQGSQIVASHIIKKKGIKSRSVALVLIMRPSRIPCSITLQGNNTGPIEPHCGNNKIIEEVSRPLVTHFPLTSSSRRYSAPNLIRPSYAIKLSGRKSKCNAGSRLSSAKSAGTHPATETSCVGAHDTKVRSFFCDQYILSLEMSEKRRI